MDSTAGQLLPVPVRVGQAVDVVAQAGRPKSITGEAHDRTNRSQRTGSTMLPIDQAITSCTDLDASAAALSPEPTSVLMVCRLPDAHDAGAPRRRRAGRARHRKVPRAVADARRHRHPQVRAWLIGTCSVHAWRQVPFQCCMVMQQNIEESLASSMVLTNRLSSAGQTQTL
jgi:hypothetical protein